MCGKAAVSHLSWKDIYSWASSLTPPDSLPADPLDRNNISPSRLRRVAEPESMVWESLPAIYADDDRDLPIEATWPFLPFWSKGQLPRNKPASSYQPQTQDYGMKDNPSHRHT